MRKSLWIMLAVMVVSASAPNAHADTVFAITFNGPGAPTVVGSNLLDYNSTLMEFTTPDLLVTFEGVTGVDLMATLFAPVNLINPPVDTFDWVSNTDFLAIVVNNNFAEQIYVSTNDSISNALPTGTVTLTAQTPEPSNVGLILLGLGLVLLLRKRNSRGHQLAT